MPWQEVEQGVMVKMTGTDDAKTALTRVKEALKQQINRTGPLKRGKPLQGGRVVLKLTTKKQMKETTAILKRCSDLKTQ